MLRPTRENVLLEVFTESEKVQGGVLMPEIMTQERQAKGVVVAVGKMPMEYINAIVDTITDDKEKSRASFEEFKVGNTVRFKRFASDTWKEDGKTYIIVSYKDILGIIE